MTERYFPVPVWNGMIGQWEPVDFYHGQRVVRWPDDFDSTQLPIPEYQDGDRVQFVRDETCAREGVIRRVLFDGDISTSPEKRDKPIKHRDFDAENITYIVTARGHDHRIKAWNILGRFVSLERVSRILSPQE
jgi:hypothetical protein